MGGIFFILIFATPIVALILKCKASVRVTAAIATWLFLYVVLGKIATQQSGEPFHLLFVSISVVFIVVAFIVRALHQQGGDD